MDMDLGLWRYSPVTAGQQQTPAAKDTQTERQPITVEGRLDPYVIASGKPSCNEPSKAKAAERSPYVAIEGGIAVHPHLGEQPKPQLEDKPCPPELPPGVYTPSDEYYFAIQSTDKDFDISCQPKEASAVKQYWDANGGGMWLSGSGPPPSNASMQKSAAKKAAPKR